MGILRDRAAANTSMFRELYEETLLPEGTRMLRIVGTPVKDEELLEGTDAHAVRNGYISIGKVKAFGY